ncbi:MAG: hypothetical protein AAFV53_40985 [Myxococcota bacterium]
MRLALMLFLFACNNYPPPDPLESELTDCSADEECVVVELGCCDACNGGTAVAVNKAQEDETRDRYSERCGLNYACTLMACGSLDAVCDDGTCVLEQGDFE